MGDVLIYTVGEESQTRKGQAVCGSSEQGQNWSANRRRYGAVVIQDQERRAQRLEESADSYWMQEERCFREK